MTVEKPNGMTQRDWDATQANRERDRRANAYPQLVEALKNVLRSDQFKAVAEIEARKLLRELGE